MRTTNTDTPGAKNHVAVRLDAETIARIDALIPRLSTEWHKANRSDVMRATILQGLAPVEAQYAVGAAPSGPPSGGARAGRRGGRKARR